MAMVSAEFRPVPFDRDWVHGKLDLHAIYRRPSRDESGEHRAVDGIPQWDLTGGLPVRRHDDWTALGYEFVTLAYARDLQAAAPSMVTRGLNPDAYVMLDNDVVGRSPWNPALYLRHAALADRARFRELQALVTQHGAEAVEAIRRLDDPAFVLPASLRTPATAAGEAK